MWWCGRDVWGAGLSSFPSAGGVVSWGHGCGWVTGRILSEGLPAMSPGRVGVFGGILAVAFSLLASASGFGGLCRVLGDTPAVGVTGRTASDGLPGVSPRGVWWLAGRFSLLSFRFWLRRVVPRLGGHPCCWGYGPNCVGGTARSVPERVLWLRGPKRHSPVRTPSCFPCSKPPKTRSGRRVAVGGGGCRSRRRTWPGWRCLRRLE